VRANAASPRTPRSTLVVTLVARNTITVYAFTRSGLDPLSRRAHTCSVATEGELLDLVHSAYDVDSPEETWLSAIVERARPSLDRGLGAVGYTWDARSGRLNVRRFATAGCVAPAGVWSAALATATAEYVERAWLAKSVGTASSIAGWKAAQHREGQAALAAYGIRDILNVNASNADGNGCVIAVPLPTESRARIRDAGLWTRVAAHLAAAFRLLGFGASFRQRPLDGRLRRGCSVPVGIGGARGGRGAGARRPRRAARCGEAHRWATEAPSCGGPRATSSVDARAVVSHRDLRRARKEVRARDGERSRNARSRGAHEPRTPSARTARARALEQARCLRARSLGLDRSRARRARVPQTRREIAHGGHRMLAPIRFCRAQHDRGVRSASWGSPAFVDGALRAWYSAGPNMLVRSSLGLVAAMALSITGCDADAKTCASGADVDPVARWQACGRSCDGKGNQESCSAGKLHAAAACAFSVKQGSRNDSACRNACEAGDKASCAPAK
jgi:hypothetical protein